MIHQDLYGVHGYRSETPDAHFSHACGHYRRGDIERMIADGHLLRSRTFAAQVGDLIQGVRKALKALTIATVVWHRRNRSEAALQALTDSMPADIGLSRDEIAIRVREAIGPEQASQWLDKLTTKFADRASGRWARRSLARLDDRMLNDIGLNRLDVAAALHSSSSHKRHNDNHDLRHAA